MGPPKASSFRTKFNPCPATEIYCERVDFILGYSTCYPVFKKLTECLHDVLNGEITIITLFTVLFGDVQCACKAQDTDLGSLSNWVLNMCVVVRFRWSGLSHGHLRF